MNIKKFITLCLTSIILINIPLIAFAQDKKRHERSGIEIEYEPKSEKSILLYSIKNNSTNNEKISLSDVNRQKHYIDLSAGETRSFDDGFECYLVEFANVSGNDNRGGIWRKSDSTKAWVKHNDAIKEKETIAAQKPVEETKAEKVEKAEKQPQRKEPKEQKPQEPKQQQAISGTTIINSPECFLANIQTYL